MYLPYLICGPTSGTTRTAPTNYYQITRTMDGLRQMYFCFRRPRGMFFSRHDKGEMASMVYNWEGDDVDAVVG